MRRRVGVTVLFVATAAMGVSRRAVAQSDLLTARELVRACARAAAPESPTDTFALHTALSRVCAWSVPTTARAAEWKDPTFWRSLDTLRRRRSELIGWANRPGMTTPLGGQTGRGLQAFGQRSLGLSEGVAAGSSAVLWGITDFVIRRAEQEVRATALPWASDRLCVRPLNDVQQLQGISFMPWPDVCRMLEEGAESSTLASRAFLTGLSAAARRDATTLPLRLLAQAARSGGGEVLNAETMLVLTSFVTDVLSGVSPADAATGLSRSLAPLISSFACPDNAPATAGQRAYSLLTELALLLSEGFDTGLKVRWINGQKPRIACMEFPEFSASALPSPPDEVLRAFSAGSAVVSAMDDAAEALVEPVSGSAEEQARLRLEQRVRVVAAAWRIVDAVVAGTHDAAGDRLIQSRLRGIRVTTMGVASGNFGDAFGGVVLLLPQLCGLFPDSAAAGAQSKADCLRVERTIQRLYSVVVELAQADGAEAVRQALESFAAPPGTGMAKRQNDGRFLTLNAYLGAVGGWETLTAESAEGAAFIGPTLPLGIEYRLLRGRGGALGVFVQMLDLGALAAWRIDNDTTVADQPEVGFAQVFAPGISVVWGIPVVSASFGAGYSFAPALRDLSTQSSNAGAKRWHVFLAWDVPLFVLSR